jgi:hypothetical protein
MARKYRILSKRENWGKPGKPERRPTGKPEIPVEAVHLTEDIFALELAITMLRSIDVANITKDREFGDVIMRATVTQLRACHRYAQLKMRRDYLAP